MEQKTYRELAQQFARAVKIMEEEMYNVGVGERVSPDFILYVSEKCAVSALIQIHGNPMEYDMTEVIEPTLNRIEYTGANTHTETPDEPPTTSSPRLNPHAITHKLLSERKLEPWQYKSLCRAIEHYVKPKPKGKWTPQDQIDNMDAPTLTKWLKHEGLI